MFVNSWKSEFIWIFSPNLIWIFAYLFHKNVYSDVIYASKNILCKILFRESMSEPFKLICSIIDMYKYLKNMTLEYLYLCYFRNTNIFGHSFGKYAAFKDIHIFVRYIILHPNLFGYSFVSILWYSLITIRILGFQGAAKAQGVKLDVAPSWLHKSCRMLRSLDPGSHNFCLHPPPLV